MIYRQIGILVLTHGHGTGCASFTKSTFYRGLVNTFVAICCEIISKHNFALLHC